MGRASGSDNLAFAILRAELGEDPPPAVFRKYRTDVLDRVFDRWEIRIEAQAVWRWIEENRRLVEVELFEKLPAPEVDEPDVPALAPSAEADVTTVEEPLSDAAASKVVRACEDAWEAIRAHHPDLRDAVMILGSGGERGRLVKLGHWWAGRWVADDEARGEVLLAGEALHLKPDEVFEVLLHEAAHGLNAARGVKDTSREGRYHNARFGAAARDVGLQVSAIPPYGVARTALTSETRERYRESIDRLGEVMRVARQIQRGVRVGTARGQEQEAVGRPATSSDRGAGPLQHVAAAASSVWRRPCWQLVPSSAGSAKSSSRPSRQALLPPSSTRPFWNGGAPHWPRLAPRPNRRNAPGLRS